MKLLSRSALLGGLTASLLATPVSAQASTTVGDDNDIRFRWGVPEAVASSGSGSVYFQINASTSYSWIGLGIGSRMAGAEMFIMYEDGDGGVTLSTREARGHVMPQYTARPGVQVIQGSGVYGGRMIANVRCRDCDSLDLEGQNSWIAAWKNGDALDSKSVREPISEHDGQTAFRVNLAGATVSGNGNPFLGSSGEEDGDNGNRGVETSDSESNNDNTIIIMAHGVIMTIVFVGLYPLGAILMPLLGKWFIHAGMQVLAFLLMWAAFGLGYVFANRNNALHTNHALLGIVVVSLLGIQPILGWLHHRHYAKYQGRGIISHIHIWYGRILMILGIVNGGLGLNLAGNTKGAWLIAYVVVASVMAFAYVGAVFVGIRRKHQKLAMKA